ncbi:MAG TPA: hypothetical protein VEQ42_04540 [Pyrinomonadaceae bacterium]|nr:hypothetical protein [Pyrinomonadaceae bacterium]
MSELRQHLWAVISERGREASGLTHADAARLVRELSGARVRGLCVVTDGAARHIARAEEEAGGRRSEVS